MRGFKDKRVRQAHALHQHIQVTRLCAAGVTGDDVDGSQIALRSMPGLQACSLQVCLHSPEILRGQAGETSLPVLAEADIHGLQQAGVPGGLQRNALLLGQLDATLQQLHHSRTQLQQLELT